MATAVTDVDAKCKLKDVKGTLWYFYVRNKKKKNKAHYTDSSLCTCRLFFTRMPDSLW